MKTFSDTILDELIAAGDGLGAKILERCPATSEVILYIAESKATELEEVVKSAATRSPLYLVTMFLSSMMYEDEELWSTYVITVEPKHRR